MSSRKTIPLTLFNKNILNSIFFTNNKVLLDYYYIEELRIKFYLEGLICRLGAIGTKIYIYRTFNYLFFSFILKTNIKKKMY
jgi:hypothetical protein